MKDKELRKLIGSRVKQRRLELNLTQPYVAEKMGVTAVSYTHLPASSDSSSNPSCKCYPE